MFCPKCATQNLDGASFCRGCGANISLVSQALTGQLATTNEETGVSCEPGRKRRRQLTLDQAFKNVFMGIAFLIIAIVLSRTIGQAWWFWMLLPAFSLMGTGIAQYIRIREREKHYTPSLPPSPARHTEQLMPPPVPSVTEGTTRHLNSKNSDRR
jgi:hypothetical protein